MMNSQDKNIESARIFRRSNTKTGRLLARLYGDSTPSQNPSTLSKRSTLRRRSSSSTQEPHDAGAWKISVRRDSGNSSKENNIFKERAKNIKVPKFSSSRSLGSDSSIKVDVSSYSYSSNPRYIPKRKNKEQCEEEIQKSEMKRNAYRPPIHHNNDKQQLCDIFAHGGGRALPQELTHPPRNDAKISVNNSKSSKDVSNADKIMEDPETLLRKQIVTEIEERRTFQNEMEKTGSGHLSRQRIANEISSRMQRLKRLDSKT